MRAPNGPRTGPFRAFGLVAALLRRGGPVHVARAIAPRQRGRSTMTTLVAALVAAVALLTMSPSSTPTSGSAAPVVHPMDVIPPMGI
jgi:hypothetical protein